ncbi:MAG: nickel pincer cofactor biosynthesis protein LarC, partial [Eubacterium sp.]|nr:nickel pincer cofactor biosynthesis protein LarC [Eubacterium sp.]
MNQQDNQILYLECASGISGDMTVAALLDLGANEKKLRDALQSLPLDGYQIQISRVKKSGLDACDFAVILDATHENHDHDMAYLHDHHQEHSEHAHHHYHHHHEETHCHHAHVHRGLAEIRAIIDAGALTPGAKALAYRMFEILAEAEAKAHGVFLQEVHFHEVGAVDSIVDIVAVAVCLDDLAPEKIVLSPLTEGSGTVRCQHGILPIPVPAVTNIVQAHGLTLCQTAVEGELVTPTGAAIAATLLQKENCLPQQYTIQKVGIGAGKRSYATAGILRAMWLKEESMQQSDRILKLEANIDDVTGEELGYCMQCLLEAGAKDVSFVPIYMKKNRPAYELHVICLPEQRTQMEEIIFRETTTIGIRRIEMERTLMERRIEEVETPYGTARAKICSYA